MKIIFSLIIFLSYSGELFSASLLRLDTVGIEEFMPYSNKYTLIIEDQCAYCQRQIEVFKECALSPNEVIIFFSHPTADENVLRRKVKKKNIPYKTYLLNAEIKKALEFKGVTPMMWITSDKDKKSFTGVVSCERLKSPV